MSTNWNPRYEAYARAHERRPEEMLAFDAERFPGGKMTGYIHWINKKWTEWSAINGYRRTAYGFSNHILTEDDHKNFDAWLSLENS